MDLNNEILKIKLLVSKNELYLSLSELKKISNNQKINKEIYLLSSRLSDLDHKTRTGQIDFKDEEVLRNRIRANILDLIELVENPEIIIHKRTKKRLTWLAGTLVIFILIFSAKPIVENFIFPIIEKIHIPKKLTFLQVGDQQSINTVSLSNEEKSVDTTFLKITENAAESVVFSISSQSDVQELYELYLEVEKIAKCNENTISPGILVNLGEIPTYEYELELHSSIKYYRLLPNTVNNLKDSWKYDKGDITKFIVNFYSNDIYSAELKIVAKFLDHKSGDKRTIISEKITYFGDYCDDKPFIEKRILQDGKINVSPFLYKLMTSKKVLPKIDKENKEHKNLCKVVLGEILAFHQINTNDLKVLTDKMERDKLQKYCNGTKEGEAKCINFKNIMNKQEKLNRFERRILEVGQDLYKLFGSEIF